MTNEDNLPEQAADLRRQAEEIAREKAAQSAGKLESMSLDEIQEVLHELRVHQIELEMQNEELRRVQLELDTARTWYFDLYDMAPVGYVTLSEQGLILEANLTAATLLGVAQGELVNQPLTRFILPEDQDIYYLHRKQHLETGAQQACDLRMLRAGGVLFWAHIDTAAQDTAAAPVRHGPYLPDHFPRSAMRNPQCAIVLTDISKRKQAEETLQQRTHELGERVKELNCLFDLSHLVETCGESIEALLQGVAELLPPAWQYPRIACARITFDGLTFSTARFEQTPWRQQRSIRVRGALVGSVELCYQEARPDEYEGPFLRQEGWLLEVVAERLGRAVERIQTQQALRQSESRAKAMFQAIPDLMFRMDSQGVFLDYKADISDLYVQSEPTLIGKRIREIAPPEFADLIDRQIRAALDAGVPQSFEYRLTVPGRGVRDYEARMATSGADEVTAIVRDITERKQAEGKFREVTGRLHLATASAKAGVWDWNLRTNEMIWDDRMFELYGLTQENFPGGVEAWERGLHPGDSSKAIEECQAALRGERDFDTEFRVLRPDGTVVHIKANGLVLRDEEGKPLRMIGLNIDVTDRKQADAEKEKLEALNQQLQKSESLGRMAGAIAHHFNNQLQVVGMNLEMAVSILTPVAGKPAEFLTAALQATRYASEVSSMMLTYLGQTHGKHELMDLSEACCSKLPMLMAAMPKHIALDTDFPSPGPLISGNAKQVQQVLINLVTNAWEAGDGAPYVIHVSVKTATPSDISESHRFPLGRQLQHDVYACLEVADSGCGIAAKDIDNLFDPYFSSKFTGRGMGLAVVLGIVRAHKGVITVESEPGRGSIFRVYFPLTAGSME
jgi:PAS domain S-box-containing protein